MKAKSRDEKVDELRPEYDLGRLLRKGVQGKYADRYREGTNLVLLAPDVAKAFPTSRPCPPERTGWSGKAPVPWGCSALSLEQELHDIRCDLVRPLVQL